MTLAQLREKLSADRTKAADLRTKASAAGATDADMTAYQAGIDEVQRTLNLVKMAEQEESLDAKTAKPADAPAGIGHNSGDNRPFAAVKQTVSKEQGVLMGIAAMAKSATIKKATGEDVSPIKLLQDEGYGDYVNEQQAKAAMLQKAGVFSTVSSSVLLPQPVAADIIPILYPETTFLQGGPRRVQLIGGTYRQPRGVGSATASYVGEGAKKPVGAPTFDDIRMSSHKLAGIVYYTNEAAKWTLGRLEEYIRGDLRRVLGLKMDSAMYFGTGAGATPLGIFNKPGITTVTGVTFADPKNPTIGELDRFATIAMLSMTGANIVRSNRWRWVMGYRALAYLGNLRDGNGNAIYPGTQDMANPSWKGVPVLVSNQVAENGGATTDEGLIGLVDFSHVLYAEEEGMTMKASTEATIDDGGTLVLLWQQNMAAILTEMEHDVGLDQPKAVAKATIRWGAV